MSREALWQAIVENPEDRTVRLIYADWLEEHSDDPEDLIRAELIRAQIKVEGHPPRSRKVSAPRRRARAILKEWGKSWSRGLGPVARSPEFRAGFIEHVQTSATTFARKGEELLDRFPTITSVYFHRASNELDELLSSNLLPRLRRVDISNMCSCGHCGINREIVDLVRSPQMESITHLNLSGNRITLETVEVLAQSPHLGKLRWLDLHNNPLVPLGSIRAMLRLFRASWLDSLEHLDLRGVPLSQTMRKAWTSRLGERVVLDQTEENDEDEAEG